MPGQYLEHPFHDLHYVRLAFAQILIFYALKLIDQLFGLLREGPFCVAALGGDELLGCLRERLIAQNHQVKIKEAFEFGRRVGGNVFGKCRQFIPCGLYGFIESRLFLGDFLDRD